MARRDRQWIEALESRCLLAADLVINEFVASNKNGLADQDGEFADWIEIKNQGNSSINLAGWGLTDKRDLTTRWVFPSKTLGAGQYLVVFASEKNVTTGSQFHTDFRLDAGGEYLALVEPDGVTVKHAFDPFPVQSQDISYGLAPDDQSEIYFLTPTPGAANQLITDVVTFSEPSRTFTSSMQLTLSTTDTGATIRYTLDRSTPTSTNGFTYSGPITLTNTTVVRAKVYKSGYASGAVTSREYFELDTSVADFDSNLPVVLLDTFGGSLGGTNLTPIAAYLVDVDPLTGRASPLNGATDFSGRGGLRYRGQSSQGFPKHQFALEIWDEANKDQNASLLGMPSDSDWILYAPYSEKALMQNALAYEWSNRMGQYAVRTRFVEVFLNTSSGSHISYSGDYLGVYILMEKIKIDDDRVDITPMTPQDNSGTELTGGYIFKKDKNDGGEPTINTPRHSFLYVEPAANEITQQQKDYLSGHLNEFESVLYDNAVWKDPANGYAKYIDIQSFIDHHIMVELAKNIDGYRISTYYYKDRGGKIKMGPIWDYNLSLGNADYLQGWEPTGWYYPQVGAADYPWFARLFQDSNFQQAYIDRWQELRSDKFSTARLMQDIDEYVGELSDHNGNYPVGSSPTQASNNPVVRNFKRWNILGVELWPNYYYPSAWIEEVNWVKTFVTQRAAWMDSQYLARPTVTTSGDGAGPTTVTISGGGGSIYYTLDGSDPRAHGGGVSPSAILYTGPFQRSTTTRIKARVMQSTTRWSGLANGIVQYDNGLRITELNYHPYAPPEGSSYQDEDFEFIELRNISNASINLAGYTFTDGITYTFPARTLGAGQYLLLVKNASAFASRYPGVAVDGTYTGSLDNAGERLRLVSPIEAEMFDFNYHDGNDWPGRADGDGSTLEVVDLTWGMSLDTKRNWRSSTEWGGTPKAAGIGPLDTIVVNEVLSNSDQTGLVDAIELHNRTGGDINIGGWYLTDSQDNYKKFRIPDNTMIPAGGYILFDEGDFNPTPATPEPHHFALDGSHGDDVWLVKADASGNLQQFVDSVHFDAALPNETFGRWPNGSGKLLPMNTRTLGSANTGGVRFGPVIISEVMYHPLNGNEDLEFIELYNTTDAPIDMSNWKLEGAVRFTFAPGTIIEAHGALVVIRYNPLIQANGTKIAAFRSAYGLGLGVTAKLVGGYTGQLDNAGDNIQLLRPDVPPPTEPTFTPYVPVDEVEYAPVSPWPAVNGTGKSMSRLDESSFTNDPASWSALTPSPGVIQMTDAYARGFAGDDRWTLRLNAAGTMLELYINTGSSSPILTRSIAEIDTLTLYGLDGNDQVTVDYVNGNPVPAGGLVFDGAGGNDNLIVLETGAATPAMQTLTFHGGAGANSVVLHGGVTNLVTTQTGTLSLLADTAAQVTLAQSTALVALSLFEGSVLSLPAGTARVLKTDNINFQSGGRVDLADNRMIVQAANPAALMPTIAGYLRQSRNGGAWNGAGGIFTSLGRRGAGLALAHNGAGSNNLFDQWGPYTLDGNSILLRHTYEGDADLSGVVDATDFFVIDNDFMDGNATPSYGGGDFNFDGKVNIGDYLIIDRSFAMQAGPMSAESQPQGAAVAPSSEAGATPSAEPSPTVSAEPSAAPSTEAGASNTEPSSSPSTEPLATPLFSTTGMEMSGGSSLFDPAVEDKSQFEFDSADSSVLS